MKSLRNIIRRSENFTLASSLLDGIHPNARAVHKALAMSSLSVPRVFTYLTLKITVQSAQTLKNGTLEVRLTATRAGQPLDLTEANPFIFVNPPIMVPDGTMREVEIRGKRGKVHNFREDVEAAFQEMVGHAVMTAISHHGI